MIHLSLMLAVFAALPAQASKLECVYVQELKTGKVVHQIGDKSFCKQRQSPCSTFKIPLALMAFETKTLLDTEFRMQWDGKPQFIKAWEKDHNPKSWMKESVVWFSQRLTPKIGLKKIKSFLKGFQYGNQDFSGGVEKAWLNSSLAISPIEQVAFLRRLKLGTLNVSEKTQTTVLSLLPTEGNTKEIIGKTGSGSTDQADGKTRTIIGWYVGYLEKNGKSYAFASVYTEHALKGPFVFSGAAAKKRAIEELTKL